MTSVIIRKVMHGQQLVQDGWISTQRGSPWNYTYHDVSLPLQCRAPAVSCPVSQARQSLCQRSLTLHDLAMQAVPRLRGPRHMAETDTMSLHRTRMKPDAISVRF